MYFAPALAEAPHLLTPAERIKQALVEGDMAAARANLPELEGSIDATKLSPRAERAARRGLRELADGLGEDSYWRQRAWRKVVVIFAGPGANLLLSIVLFFALFLIVGGTATRTVEMVSSDRPAAQAGLMPGDEIIAVNGDPVQADEISSHITSSDGKPVRLTVRRQGQIVQLKPVAPRMDQGAYRLGFRLDAESLGPAAALWQSVRLTGIVTKEIGASLTRLVRGQGREDVASPVGIVQGSSNALDQGAETYLWVLGLLSLSLALLNLLPLLPLDGGHITFSIIEGIRGRALGREVYERVSLVGIALVLLLFAVGLTNDINRLSGG
jgi:regulator of sigma E protease